MMTGLVFIVMGLLVLYYPRILEVLFATFLIVFGAGIMAMSWQFRRLRKRSKSRFVNWVVRW